MANTERILRKLELYRKDPDIVQPISNSELADLVVVVLSQVRVIEEAIKKGRLDGYTPQADKDYLSKESATRMLKVAISDAIKTYDKNVTNRTSQYDAAVRESLDRLTERVNNLKDGADGVVTDAEIERAATMALGMIKLPDFDALVSETITKNANSVRDALELLSGEDRYKVQIADVEGLADALRQLAQVRGGNGGTIGKQQVYGFIRQAIADGTITSGLWRNGSATTNNILTVSATEPENPQLNDLWIDIS